MPGRRGRSRCWRRRSLLLAALLRLSARAVAGAAPFTDADGALSSAISSRRFDLYGGDIVFTGVVVAVAR